METQWQMTLRYLQEEGSITDLDALREFSIRRLAAVVYKLRSKGYNIKTTTVGARNKYGKPVHFARYNLED